jgi:glutathione S-transferase
MFSPDAEFLAINPAVYIPVLQDGDITMVESVAMMEYLIARYGPTPLAPGPHDPAFPAYQQFLHLGEAGLATLMMPVIVSRFMAPEAERHNWGANWAQDAAQRRLRLVGPQLARSPYIAGEAFTAADISVTYGLELGRRHDVISLGDAEEAYLARTMGRDAYKRALETSQLAVQDA